MHYIEQGHENNSITFNGKVYQQLPYDMLELTIVNFVGELNIPVFLNNGCMFSILYEHYHDNHEILHICKKMPADNIIMHTGNGNIQVHFRIVIPLFIQQVAIQLQLLVCDTKATEDILFGKGAFHKLGCWQDYTNRIVYIKQLMIPLDSERVLQ